MNGVGEFPSQPVTEPRRAYWAYGLAMAVLVFTAGQILLPEQLHVYATLAALLVGGVGGWASLRTPAKREPPAPKLSELAGPTREGNAGREQAAAQQKVEIEQAMR